MRTPIGSDMAKSGGTAGVVGGGGESLRDCGTRFAAPPLAVTEEAFVAVGEMHAVAVGEFEGGLGGW